nr:MAG TPA: CCSMST1 family protein [Caudoviricetes sp.]
MSTPCKKSFISLLIYFCLLLHLCRMNKHYFFRK